MSAPPLRPLKPADLDAIDGLNPPDWAPYRPTFEHYFSTSCAQPYGLDLDGGLAAMGTLITFGASAWIAQLITHPEARGRGLGTKVLDGLLAMGRSAGVKTFSLVATELGFPLYQKAGFEVEGWYEFWTRDKPAPVTRGGTGLTRPLEPADLPAVAALDRWATGEDRRAYWERLTEGARVAGASSIEGVWLPRLGEGLVVASHAEAGAALLHARLDGSQRCVVPEGHGGAQEILVQRGFTLSLRARRMVLGPALDRHPEGLWSRVAGNLG